MFDCCCGKFGAGTPDAAVIFALELALRNVGCFADFLGLATFASMPPFGVGLLDVEARLRLPLEFSAFGLPRFGVFSFSGSSPPCM